MPKPLKVDVIKPLYKNCIKGELVNYSPVTLISNISKIIENIIKHRLVKFLDKDNIISCQQFEFRDG